MKNNAVEKIKEKMTYEQFCEKYINDFSTEEIINGKNYDYYAVFCINCFNYLNGKINNIVIQKFAISPDRNYNDCQGGYEVGRHLNNFEVVIFLPTLIYERYIEESIDFTETEILLCVAHELSHCAQNTNMIKYSKDPKYNKFIEDQADFMAINYIISECEKLRELFDNAILDLESLNYIIGKKKLNNKLMKNFKPITHDDIYNKSIFLLSRIKYKDKCGIDIRDYKNVIFCIDIENEERRFILARLEDKTEESYDFLVLQSRFSELLRKYDLKFFIENGQFVYFSITENVLLISVSFEIEKCNS